MAQVAILMPHQLRSTPSPFGTAIGGGRVWTIFKPSAGLVCAGLDRSWAPRYALLVCLKRLAKSLRFVVCLDSPISRKDGRRCARRMASSIMFLPRAGVIAEQSVVKRKQSHLLIAGTPYIGISVNCCAQRRTASHPPMKQRPRHAKSAGTGHGAAAPGA